MITIGNVEKGQGYPDRAGGLIVPFKESGDQFRLFIPNIQMDWLAQNAISNTGKSVEPGFVEVRSGEEPRHCVDPVQTIGNNGDRETVSVLRTIDDGEFFGVAFRARKKFDDWITTEMREGQDLQNLMDFAIEMSSASLKHIVTRDITLKSPEAAEDIPNSGLALA